MFWSDTLRCLSICYTELKLKFPLFVFLWFKLIVMTCFLKLTHADSPMAQQTGFQSQIESYQRLKKLFLMPPCLTLCIIRYESRANWSNPGKGVAPFTTPRCGSFWKGSLWVTPWLRSSTLLFFLFLEQFSEDIIDNLFTFTFITVAASDK